MITDYSFAKIYAGNAREQTAKDLLQWLEARCEKHGLLPLPSEQGAHCSVMLISDKTRWLHFSSLGHFLPESTHHYKPFTHLLSQKHPVIGYQGRDGGPYILRRFAAGKVTARYAIFEEGRHFDSEATAMPWNPVREDWQDLLDDAVTEEDFYRLLPSAQHPDAPKPTYSYDLFDLPEHFNRLFGWNPELNYASIEFYPDGPEGRGDFYEAQSGDYVDQERGLSIFVRHYAHPDAHAGYEVVL